MARTTVAATDGFDVTVERVIGTVNIGEGRDIFPTAIHAAFNLIANEDTPGRYRFPLSPSGGACVVTVEYEVTEQ